MKSILLWTLLFLVVLAVLSAVQFLLRKKEIKSGWRIALAVMKFVIAVACAALVMAGPVFLRPVQVPLVAVYAVLLPDAVGDFAYTLVQTLRKKQRKFQTAKIISVVLCVLFFVYGTVNMQIVTPQYSTFSSSKLTAEHTFVFVSDLHVGSSQSFEVTKKAIAAIGAQEPDFVILGGDITDDYTSKEDMEETYRLFGALGVPVYYIDGNHEVVQYAEYLRGGLPYTEEELYAAIQSNGITVLQDEYTEIASDLLLLGREDAASEKRADKYHIENPDPDKFLLTADHQPLEKDNMRVGTDLQVSGHTHAGQLFPLKALYGVIGYVYGDYAFDGAVMRVSAGASGWRAPFRTDAHCHFEVITLKPEK